MAWVPEAKLGYYLDDARRNITAYPLARDRRWVSRMVTESDLFAQVVVTRAENDVPRGVAGVLMDVFPEFVIIESPPASEDDEPGIWAVARDAVARVTDTAAA